MTLDRVDVDNGERHKCDLCADLSSDGRAIEAGCDMYQDGIYVWICQRCVDASSAASKVKATLEELEAAEREALEKWQKSVEGLRDEEQSVTEFLSKNVVHSEFVQGVFLAKSYSEAAHLAGLRRAALSEARAALKKAQGVEG